MDCQSQGVEARNAKGKVPFAFNGHKPVRVIALYHASETEWAVSHTFPEQGIKVISYFTRTPKRADIYDAETGEDVEDTPF